MVLTIIIETALVLKIIWRYKQSMVVQLSIATLLLLALFQLSEYFVCTTSMVNWQRVGYVSITLLPVVGLHLLFVLAGNNNRRLVFSAYGVAVLLCVYFAAVPTAFKGQVCLGNYVMFKIGRREGLIYGTYYFGILLQTIHLAFSWLKQHTDKLSAVHKNRKAIISVIVGYFVFIVPTALSIIIFPDSSRGIPSIMCGFAVIYAVIVAFWLLPNAEQAVVKKHK